MALLVAAICISFWTVSSRSAAREHGQALLAQKERIQSDLLLMNEGLRALALDVRNQTERTRHDTAEADLGDALREAHELAQGDPELAAAFKAIDEFALQAGTGSFGAFEKTVLQTADNDPVHALSAYNAGNTDVAKQRDSLLRGLARQIVRVNNSRGSKAQFEAIIGFLGLALILGAAVLIWRQQSSSVAEPLRRLGSALEQMRRGDFSSRIELPQQDEFRALGGEVNRLADDISEFVGQVQRSGSDVNTSAAQIADASKEQQAATQKFGAAAAQIGARSRLITATTQELAKAVEAVKEEVAQTAGAAGNGRSAVEHIEASLRQLIENCSTVSSRLSSLSEKTGNINTAIATITKVADQTNLLSLNAAIEAEKAGEYGLGFAVVAMEIRRLADQTGVAAYDIEKIVKELQAAVAVGVSGMDRFVDALRNGLEEARQASSHLDEVVQKAQALGPRFQVATENTNTQLSEAKEIGQTLSQLGETMQSALEALRESRAAIEHLSGAAQGLQSTVAKYRLNGAAKSAPVGEGAKPAGI